MPRMRTIPGIMQSTTNKPRSTAGLWIAVALLGCGLIFSILVNAGLMASLFAKGISGGGSSAKSHRISLTRGHPVDEEPMMNEVWSYGHGDTKVVRIAVDGVIMRGAEGGFFDVPVDKIESILAQIRVAKNDEDVMGIILEVDSPGGGVTPSDEIYNALQDFKESDDNRKVVVFMRDLAASGGYYVAMAGDWLLCEPTTMVGSIGVIMQSMNFKGLSEKVGVHDVTIKSGKNKDLLNPFIDVNPEQIAILQKMIDATYERFFGIVHENRQIAEPKLREMADGRIFDAAEALKLKLVDQIGYWDDSIAKMAELLGEDDVQVIRYENRTSVFDRLLSARTPPTPVSAFQEIQNAMRPRLQYLWQP